MGVLGKYTCGFANHPCQTEESGLPVIVLMTLKCWYNPKHGNHAQVEQNWNDCVNSICGGCRSDRSQAYGSTIISWLMSLTAATDLLRTPSAIATHTHTYTYNLNCAECGVVMGFEALYTGRGRINPVWSCLAWYSVTSTWSGRPFKYVIWSIRDDFF